MGVPWRRSSGVANTFQQVGRSGGAADAPTCGHHRDRMRENAAAPRAACSDGSAPAQKTLQIFSKHMTDRTKVDDVALIRFLLRAQRFPIL